MNLSVELTAEEIEKIKRNDDKIFKKRFKLKKKKECSNELSSGDI